eukprot:1921270-Prymnesium_polylepis.1
MRPPGKAAIDSSVAPSLDAIFQGTRCHTAVGGARREGAVSDTTRPGPTRGATSDGSAEWEGSHCPGDTLTTRWGLSTT